MEKHRWREWSDMYSIEVKYPDIMATLDAKGWDALTLREFTIALFMSEAVASAAVAS